MVKIGICGLTILLFIPQYARAGNDPIFGNSRSATERSGDWLQLLIPFSALAYSSVIADWEGVSELALSYGTTAVATEILKNTIREERPYQPEGEDGKTFPSGHTSAAFAGASYWQTRYGWAVGAPMYAAAAYVGWTRVEAYKHNWLDVFAGAALGIGVNFIFVTRYPGVKTLITPTDGGIALHISTNF